MGFKRRAMALALAGALGSAFLGEYSPSAADDAGSPDDSSRARARRFRSSVGFPTDDLTIDRAERRHGHHRFGVALSPEEEADLDFRMLIQEAMSDVERRASREAGFAGLWIDQRAGGVVNVAVVEPVDPSALARDVSIQLPPGTRVRVVSVERTATQLDELLARVRGRCRPTPCRRNRDRGICVGHSTEPGSDRRPRAQQ